MNLSKKKELYACHQVLFLNGTVNRSFCRIEFLFLLNSKPCHSLYTYFSREAFNTKEHALFGREHHSYSHSKQNIQGVSLDRRRKREENDEDEGEEESDPFHLFPLNRLVLSTTYPPKRKPSSPIPFSFFK